VRQGASNPSRDVTNITKQQYATPNSIRIRHARTFQHDEGGIRTLTGQALRIQTGHAGMCQLSWL
jgi:hypothetical protein